MIKRNYVPPFDASKGIEIGIYSLGDHVANPHTNSRISEKERIKQFIEMAKLAEDAGLDVFDLGESHQEFFVSQAQNVILGAVAQATSKIKIMTSATLMSVHDPVLLFEDYATLDHLSDGRIEVVGGRASRIGAFDLLGYDVKDYEALFEEKFELFNLINREEYVTWNGQFRAPLKNAHIIPRPLRSNLPVWRAVGGPANSAIRAGQDGMPMVLAHLSGPVSYYKNTIDYYRSAATRAGYDASTLPITTGGFFYAAETTNQAMRDFYPHVDTAFYHSNGQRFPKSNFAQASDPYSVLNVGSADDIIEKLVLQHQTFGMQRYIAQIDLGGMPFDKIMQTINIMGSKIVPEVKKRTARGKE